jgi:hypothetical protein
MSPRQKHSLLVLFLLIFVTLEFTCYFLFDRTQKFWGISPQANSIIGFLFALIVGALFLSLSQYKFCKKETTPMRWWYSPGGLLVIIITAGALLPRFIDLFAANPINVHYSDIIPQVQLLLSKFLAGKNPYEPTRAFGYLLHPTYLPAQWLPFIFSEELHIDYRFTPLLLFLVAALLFVFQARKNISSPLLAVVIILPFIFMLNNAPVLFIHHVELLMASYYLLLLLAIGRRSYVGIGIALALCLLSRYSLVLWLPVLFYVLAKKNLPRMLLMAGIGALLIICFYIIPFLSDEPGAYLNGLQYYFGASIGEWTYNLNKFDQPTNLFNGQGFAVFVYENFSSLSVEDKIRLMQKLGAGISLGVSVLFVWVYHRFGNRFEPGRFLVATLKIYLAVFYFFIQIPYTYLMLLPFFVSIGGVLYFQIFPRGTRN